MIGFVSRSESERLLHEQKVDATLSDIIVRVDKSNHIKEQVVSRLDKQDTVIDALVCDVGDIKTILTEMNTNTLTPEELAAVGARARRDVMNQGIDAKRRMNASLLSSIGNAWSPIVTLVAFVGMAGLDVFLALHGFRK